MNILVAENDQDYRNVLADLLQMNGHKVFKAPGGLEAYRLLHYLDVDLVISDIAMPGLSGDGLHDMVRANPNFQKIPFIYISGYPQLRGAVKTENHELDFCLSKLGPIQELIDLIGDVGTRLKRENTETNEPLPTNTARTT
jgi:CheY-like chemotaxis protein